MRAELNGLEFHVEIEGAGPPLLLLHGFTGSVRAWDGIRPDLARVAQVIAIDLIGHGQSTAPPDRQRYSIEWCARDLVALLDVLGLERVDLVGYSMGGRAALHVAVTVPDRIKRLVLESASPGIEDGAERARRVQADAALAERIEAGGIHAFVDEWERQPLLALQPHVAESERQRQHALRLLNNPVGLANSLRGMGAGQQQPLWSELAHLAMPIHLIVGEADSRYVAVARRMAERMPLARLSVVPGAGHTVHLDQPAAFVALLQETLTSRLKIASRRQTAQCQQIDTPRHTLLY